MEGSLAGVMGFGPRSPARTARWCVLVLLAGLGTALGPRGGADAERLGNPAPGLGRVLRVGTSGDYPPFSEWDPAAGVYRGFDIAVAERFGADAGYGVEWVPFRWPALTRALAGDRFDVAMGGVTVRPERTALGRFTVAVAETGAVVLVRPGLLPDTAPIPAAFEQTLRDALLALDVPAMRIAVNAGGHLERVARAQFRAARIDALADNAAVGSALAEGRADAVVTEVVEAERWRSGVPGVVPVGPFTVDRKAYWISAGGAALAAELDAWLLERERDGWLGLQREKWLGPGAAVATATPWEALLGACAERLTLMPWVAEAKREAGLAVVDSAREARVLRAAETAVRRAAEQWGVPVPPAATVSRFYRAQIDAAVAVQRATLARTSAELGPRFSLGDTLRPALLRVGERMAMLLVLASAEPANRPTRLRVEAVLSGQGLFPQQLDGLHRAFEGLAGVPTRSSERY